MYCTPIRWKYNDDYDDKNDDYDISLKHSATCSVSDWNMYVL